MYCIYSFLYLIRLPLPFLSLFQFLLSSECTQKAKPENRVLLPACAVTLRAFPAPSCPGLRMAWISRPNCPNSSHCKVRRSQEFTAHYVCICIFIFHRLQLISLYASYISACISFLNSYVLSWSVASWAPKAANLLNYFFLFQTCDESQ